MEIWTDGSCWPNPGPGGWAFIVIKDGTWIESKSGRSGYSTNNVMEIEAIRQALLLYPSPDVIYSDSLLALNMVSGVWHGKKIHLILLAKQTRALIRSRPKFIHVDGHSDTTLNDMCDELAAKARMGRSNP